MAIQHGQNPALKFYFHFRRKKTTEKAVLISLECVHEKTRQEVMHRFRSNLAQLLGSVRK